MVQIQAAKRLLAIEFVTARPSLWFRVEVLTPPRPILWCRKRDTGLYDLFYPSPRGPFAENKSDQWLKTRVRAIRDKNGCVIYADQAEQSLIQKQLTSYLRLK